MDKTIAQTESASSEPAGARVGRSDGTATRSLILQAARRRLVEEGYAHLNVRDIARDAGVNHALIGYHFGGKQPLVLAVLDDANRQLLGRQTRMYRETASASEKWSQACDFYDEDLRSGFVRLLMELMGASFHDAALRREFVPRVLAWHKLIEGAVEDFIARSGLDLPVSAQAITAWIGWFWTGMEASMMLGIDECQGHQREALAAVAELLRRVEGNPRRTAAGRRAAKATVATAKAATSKAATTQAAARKATTNKVVTKKATTTKARA